MKVESLQKTPHCFEKTYFFTHLAANHKELAHTPIEAFAQEQLHVEGVNIYIFSINLILVLKFDIINKSPATSVI